MSVRQGNNGFIAERLGGFVRDETDAPALARHSMNSQIEYSSSKSGGTESLQDRVLPQRVRGCQCEGCTRLPWREHPRPVWMMGERLCS